MHIGEALYAGIKRTFHLGSRDFRPLLPGKLETADQAGQLSFASDESTGVGPQTVGAVGDETKHWVCIASGLSDTGSRCMVAHERHGPYGDVFAEDIS